MDLFGTNLKYNYFIFFTIAGLANLILILFIYFSKKRNNVEEIKIYKYLIFVGLFSSTCEIFMFLFTPIFEQIGIFKLILPKIYLCSCELWTTLLTLYTLYTIIGSSPNEDKLKTAKSITKILYIVCLLCWIGTFIVPVELTYNDAGTSIVHISGKAVIFVLINTFFTALHNLILIIKYKVGFKDKRIYPIYIYLFFSFFVGVIQASYPSFSMINFIEALVIVFIYMSLENPDARLVEETAIAKEAAEKSNKAKTDFLSSMSHEIRTPLNTIYGLSEDNLEFKDELPSDVVENCCDIMVASKNLLEIVGNILDINKIEDNKIEIVENPYNFKEEIISLCKITAIRIGTKDIKFDLNIGQRIPDTIIGDKTHVKEIINNLLTNAIKYTDKGSIQLSINSTIDNKSDIITLLISCKDTGRGIKPEQINRLFNKFDRLDAESTNKETEGTGLGLAITKTLVSLMGGTISVESKFGEGSNFLVKLPQKLISSSKNESELEVVELNSIQKQEFVSPVKENRKVEEEIDLTKEEPIKKEEKDESLENISLDSSSESTQDSTKPNYGSKRVLIVDDNYSNVKVAKRALRGFNVEIDECYDGKDCLDKINKGENYDLILMDIMMPNLSGTKTLEKLKENPNFNTPVIALTADALAGSREKYLGLGFTEYLAKPVSKQDMKDKLDLIFKEK